MQKWQNDLETNRVLVTYTYIYKYFKTSFTFENYLNWLPLRLRVPLSKLRLASHTLRVETGRYDRARIERNERVCTFCNLDVEDEYRFIIACLIYTDICRKYLKPYYTVDSRDLEVEGTLSNTSRYPYFDISDVQN